MIDPPLNAAKRYILTRIPLARKTETIKEVIARLEKKSHMFDTIDYIYIIGAEKKLLGILSLRDIFNHEKNMRLEQIMQTSIVSVSLETEIEKIAHLALKHDLAQIPVVEHGQLIGVLSSKKILSIVNRALKEDILHFAGVHRSHLDFENSLEVPLFTVINHRLPWLIIGLLGTMVIAVYMSFFEEMLAKHIIIAAFIPAIVYMSDALGTQIQTIFIRDLAVLGKELRFRKYFFRQMLIAFCIGTITAIIMFAIIALVWKQPFIAFVIALATFFSLLTTSSTAILSTLLVKRFNFDPAIGSGPIATIISDASSVIIYFCVVMLLL